MLDTAYTPWNELRENTIEVKEYLEELLRVKEGRVIHSSNTLSFKTNYIVSVEVDNCLDNSNLSNTSYNTHS